MISHSLVIKRYTRVISMQLRAGALSSLGETF